MKEFLDYLIDSFVNIFKALIVDILEILKDIFFWIASQILTLMNWAVSWIFSKIPAINVGKYWSQVPENVLLVFARMGLAECLALIISALIIRFVLNFVPFVK